MNSHLSDDGAFAQRVFAQFWATTGSAKGSFVKFPNDGFRIQFGADDGYLGIPDAQLGENFLGEIYHPAKVAVASGHAAASEDDRTADLLSSIHHVGEI